MNNSEFKLRLFNNIIYLLTVLMWFLLFEKWNHCFRLDSFLKWRHLHKFYSIKKKGSLKETRGKILRKYRYTLTKNSIRVLTI